MLRLWTDAGLQQQLRSMLLRWCSRRVSSLSPDDLAQEVLLRVHRRIRAAKEPIKDLLGFSPKILHDIEIDELRRTRHQPLEQPDDIVDPRHEAESQRLLDSKELPMKDLLAIFPGRIQREILRSLQAGFGIRHAAESLDLPLKEVQRVLYAMCDRLRSGAPRRRRRAEESDGSP
jgi:DNA-directed RNA polymerase specialized sigma24 family protein